VSAIADGRESPSGVEKAAGTPDLMGVCADSLGALLFAPMTRHLARVVERLAGDAMGEMKHPADIHRLFHHSQRLGTRLKEACEPHVRSLEGCTTEGLALAFAACAYPARAFQMGIERKGSQHERAELVHRVAAFVEAWGELRGVASTPERVTEQISGRLLALGRFPDSADLRSFMTLCADLTDDGKGDAQREGSEERRLGGALHLSTFYSAMAHRCYEGWRREAELSRSVRRYCPVPPVAIPPGMPPRCWDEVQRLIRTCSYVLSRIVRVADPADDLSQFWLMTWERLVSGFPYFGFRARLTTWWVRCLRVYALEPPARRERLAPHVLTPDLLTVYREGYRLVRTTFAGGPEHRRALDRLWHGRLERKLKGLTVPMGEAEVILKEFPSLRRADIDNMSKRLRRRFLAYSLARVHRRSNAEIERMEVFVQTNRGMRRTLPLKNEPAVLTVATLARCRPEDQPFIWPFLTYLLLAPRVQPRHADTWSFGGLVAELSHWEPQQLEQRMTATDRGPERLVLGLDERSPLRVLLKWLASTDAGAETDERVAQHTWHAEEAEATRLLAQEVPAAALAVWKPTTLRRWRGTAGLHWLIPVWYLSVIERVTAPEVVARLKPEPEERRDVTALCQELRRTAETSHRDP